MRGHHIFFILVFLCFLNAKNDYPIVLIHGFMGWGPDEMGKYNYWGGKQDFVKILRDEDYTVFEVSVGPVSSNWERAIEVYYQLKGGQVDYGKAHSKKYNIIQKPIGKKYNGLYPEWNASNPVHIIAHSMGGQTARMLNYLLSQEIYVDENLGLAEESMLLGKIQPNLIKSITSISTPHDGTTLTDITLKVLPFLQYFVGVAGLIGTSFFDFDLEQWGFYRKENEPWSEYINRMRIHPAWDTKNISAWDLSLDGAKELNSFLQASPDIYYFSWVTSTTDIKDGSNLHIPLVDTPLLIRSRAKLIGSRSGYWNDGTPTDSTWYENDGIVNTISMYGPSTGPNGPDPIIEYEDNELLIPGQWYWKKFKGTDHWSIIGHPNIKNEIELEKSKKYLLDHVTMLRLLPSK